MQTIIILVDPEKLTDPDLDLAYVISDRIEEITKGAINDNGYDFIDSEGNPLMGIWLSTDNAEMRWKVILYLFEKEEFIGNDLSEAAEIFISENDTEDLKKCTKVYPNS